MKPQRNQTLILIGLVLLLVGMACYAECPSLGSATCKEMNTEFAQTGTASNAEKPTSQETLLPTSQLTSTTAASAEATDQIVLGTGTFTQLDPYSSFPKVVNAPLKLVISSATNVVLYYTGKVDVGLSDALGKADLDRKIVTITSCNWTDNPAKGTIDYSSGTLTGEVDCFEAGNNSSPYLKITMP